MRDALRRLFSVRPPTRIVQVRVPSIIAGRRGLPVLLSAFAVVAAASTAATTSVAVQQDVTPPAGTTLPQAAPSYSYPGSGPAGAGTPGTATPPGGTGLNGTPSAAVFAQLAANGIPARAAQAYRKAAAAAGCGVPWTLVAAIGRVESDHGRFGGATLLTDGRSAPPILGIPLDGRPGVAMIRDTDGGRWDQDTTYDRAVGPLQFIPGTWATFGVDGDNDGKIDPFDIDDAAASAAEYLCKAGGGDLSSEANQRNAVYSYNRSTAYVDTVMALAALYAGHAPADAAAAAQPLAPPTLPPGSVGDPPGAPITTTPAPTPRPTTPPPTSHPASPSGPAPTTSAPSSPPPPTTDPTTTAPSSPSPSPSPTCTPSPGSPTPTPSSSGTNTPNGTAATPAGSATGTADASGSADATGTASPTPTPTPTPSPTLPPCPS